MKNKIVNGIKAYVRDLRLLTSNAKKYLLGSFFIGMTFSSFMLLLNLYLRERGFSEGYIGSVLSAGAIGMTLISIPGAALLSRVRLKPVLAIATVLYAGFCLLTIYSDQPSMIWFAYMFAGMMMTFYRIASSPFFMRNSSERERPYLFSLSFGIAVIAGVIGSVIFGQLVSILGTKFGYDSVSAHRMSMTVGILISLLALIPFSMLKMPKEIPVEDRVKFNWSSIAPHKWLFLKLTVPYFIVGTGAGIIIPFLNLFFRDRFDQSPDQIGFYFGLINLTMFIGVMTGPILVRKIGMVRTMVFTQLASIPFMLVLAFSYNFPLVIGAFLLRGALMNMGHPIGNNFAMEMVPRSHHGLMNALLMLAWTGSWMISAKLGGQIIETYGYTYSLVMAIILYVASSVAYFAFFRGTETSTDCGYILRSKYKMTA